MDLDRTLKAWAEVRENSTPYSSPDLTLGLRSTRRKTLSPYPCRIRHTLASRERRSRKEHPAHKVGIVSRHLESRTKQRARPCAGSAMCATLSPSINNVQKAKPLCIAIDRHRRIWISRTHQHPQVPDHPHAPAASASRPSDRMHFGQCRRHLKDTTDTFECEFSQLHVCLWRPKSHMVSLARTVSICYWKLDILQRSDRSQCYSRNFLFPCRWKTAGRWALVLCRCRWMLKVYSFFCSLPAWPLLT